MLAISIILISLSSFFLTVSLKEKKDNFLFFLLIYFAQIIFNFEILSLFNSITKNNFLICNALFLIISIIIFIKSDNKLIFSNIKNDLIKIFCAIKLDKLLLFLSVLFCIFITLQLFIALFMPISFGDALSYYLPRCTAWIQNGNINHYITPDSRELIMPTNMDFLYTWVLLFKKSEIGIAIFSFISYICGIYIIYNFLKELGFCIRKRIWSIFVFSSFILLALEMCTPCADLFIGVLILNSIYLFLRACKKENSTIFYFSALSYALALGTKTTAIMTLPAVFLLLYIIEKKYKKNIYKTFSLYILFFIINFIVFSSYNYILNFIQYANPLTNNEQFLLNQFRGGFKGWLCNIIKYFFAIFDTSGFSGLDGFIQYIQALSLNIIGETDRSYTSNYFNKYFEFNSKISMTESALGIMGLLALLPSIIKSVKNKKKQTILMVLALILIINILIFARAMVFTQFNMRYLLTFVVISSPIVVYSYIKNTTILKKILSIFIMATFIIVPYTTLKKLYNYDKNIEEIAIYDYLKDNKANNVALIIRQGKSPVYYILKARLYGIKIQQPLLENIEEHNIGKFNYIITNKIDVNSSNIMNFKDKLKYKDLFITECTYTDYRNKIIKNENEKPAMVTCKIPFNYFEEKGFIKENSLNLKNYYIYKKI